MIDVTTVVTVVPMKRIIIIMAKIFARIPFLMALLPNNLYLKFAV